MHSLYLPDWVLSDIDTCRTYMAREDETDDPMLTLLMRSVSARIERYCARRLKSRVYAAASSVVVASCTTAINSKAVTGTFPVTVEPSMTVTGTGMDANTVLVGMNVARTQATLSENATASGTVSLTFARPDSRLRVSGEGVSSLALPEWPVDAVSAVAYFDDNTMAEIAVNITPQNINRLAGVLNIANDVFPSGNDNLIVAATCGYKPGVDDAELWTLEQAMLRWVQVEFQNQVNQVGRKIDMAAGESKLRLSESPVPDDVTALLAPFVRRA